MEFDIRETFAAFQLVEKKSNVQKKLETYPKPCAPLNI